MISAFDFEEAIAAGVEGTDDDEEATAVSRIRDDFEVPLGVENECALGVGTAWASVDAGLGMTGAEGRLSSDDRMDSARALLSLPGGSKATCDVKLTRVSEGNDEKSTREAGNCGTYVT